MGLTLGVNRMLQLVMIGLQVTNQLEPVLPEKWKGVATIILTTLQAGLAQWAHFYNTDGTPQTAPGPGGPPVNSYRPGA